MFKEIERITFETLGTKEVLYHKTLDIYIVPNVMKGDFDERYPDLVYFTIHELNYLTNIKASPKFLECIIECKRILHPTDFIYETKEMFDRAMCDHVRRYSGTKRINFMV